MSLVGTRPPTVDEWEQYELHHRSRMSTKPGITGMWQVSGRSDITDFEEVVRLDTLYSGAYIMASGKSVFGQERKFMNHLMLIDYMMKDHVTKKVVECRKLKELYNTLLVYPTNRTYR